jgi:hypothetical protein
LPKNLHSAESSVLTSFNNQFLLLLNTPTEVARVDFDKNKHHFKYTLSMWETNLYDRPLQSLPQNHFPSSSSLKIKNKPFTDVLDSFMSLKQSSLTAFFSSNLIDVPLVLKKSKSLFFKSFELPLVRFTNYIMRGGLRLSALKTLSTSMSMFASTWFQKTLQSMDILKFKDILNISYQTQFNGFSVVKGIQPKIGELGDDGREVVYWDTRTYNPVEMSPRLDINLPYLFFSKLKKIQPLFGFFIEKVDKAIRKNSRNRGSKWKLNWRFIPPYKRLYWSMSWFLKDSRFQKNKTITDRLLKSFELLFISPHLSFLVRLRNFVHSYVFKNFKQTLLKTLEATFK